MSSDVPGPVLDTREIADIVAMLRERIPGFVPGWRPADGDPGTALLQIFARHLHTAAQRVNLAPDKGRLAFFDALGSELLPAAAARVPVAFTPMQGVGDGIIPAGSRVGAKIEGRSDPLIFETEHAIALASARLAEVRTVWPGRDATADHTDAALRGEVFTLFEGSRPIEHELYLEHDLLFSLSGPSTVEIRFEFSATRPSLSAVWEYWDGAVWRGFRDFVPLATATSTDPVDGTIGFTRSGVVRLVTACATTTETRVMGISGRWIRARLLGALVAAPGAPMPAITRIVARTVIDRTLPAGICGSGASAPGLLPDHALAGDSPIDLTKAVKPFGTSPAEGSLFYVAMDEALARPGAEVTICFRKVLTVDEQTDQQGADFSLDANAARDLVLSAADRAATALIRLSNAFSTLQVDVPLHPNWLADLGPKVATLDAARVALPVQGTKGIKAVDSAADALVQHFANASPNFTMPAGLLWDLLGDPDLVDLALSVLGAPGAIFKSFGDYRAHNLQRVQDSITWVSNGASWVRGVTDALAQLTPTSAAMAAGATLPKMAIPVVTWEYWNGQRWNTLPVTGAATATSFRGDGPVRLTVPDDVTEIDVQGIAAHWVRARLLSGGYGSVRTVSWEDAESGKLMYFPLVQVHPPVIDAVRIGYRFASREVSPEHVVTYNDFIYAERTDNLAEGAPAFLPFSVTNDLVPSLYLGFDRPLPADALGLWLEVDEITERRPALVWEAWDGAAWSAIEVRDETANLARPGLVTITYPGGAAPPSAAMNSASGDLVLLADEASALRFVVGDQVWLQQGETGELARVAEIQRMALRLTVPLEADLSRGTVSVALPPRFGRPRTWIRARLGESVSPPAVKVTRIAFDAVWASQVETVEQESLGGSNGEPRQVFFARRTPVLEGEVLEVRELSGARAHVEAPMLVDELARRGIGLDSVRMVTDPRSGRTTDVWVRWRSVSNLLFAAAGDRVYMLERSRGRIVFGGDGHGMAPPPGSDVVRMRRYLTGGGVAGNVASGAVNQILAGVLAERVNSVRAAEGGAAGESLARFRIRAPALVRHRRQAISARDYEDLALEASPAVAVVRALPATHPGGRAAPGWVTLRIVPWGDEPRPVASYELRRTVESFLDLRVPAQVRGRVNALAAEYFPVDVRVSLATMSGALPGQVVASAEAALVQFLHPLTGGPEGTGWRFGRDLYLSDVAALLESLGGVDYVDALAIGAFGTTAGNRLAVPLDRIIVVGTLLVTLAGN